MSPQDDLFKVQVRQSDACDRQGGTARSSFHLPREPATSVSLLSGGNFGDFALGEFGTSMPPASRWLDHSEEKIKVLNQQASEFPWARTWTSLTFVPTPPSPPGTKTSCSWPAPSFMLHWITFCCALYLPGLYRQVSEWITYCGQAPSDDH